jgi:hypothetical protein
MHKRPITILLPAIALFIAEAMGLAGGLMQLATAKLSSPALEAANPALKMMRDNPDIASFQQTMAPISIVVALVGIVVALLLLKGATWSRIAAMALVIVHALLALIGTWFAVTKVIPATLKAVTEMPEPKASMGDIVAISMKVGAWSGAIFWIAICILLLVMLSRTSAKAWCSPRSPLAAPPALPRR